MGKQAQKKGYDWEKTFKKSFDKAFPNGFIYKLIDTHSIEGVTQAAKKQNAAWGKMTVPKVPSDYICLNDGETIWVECKNTMNQTSFPLGNIKEHQFQFAADIEAAGGKYYFAIRRHEPRNHECFLLTLNDIIRLKKANDNRKSIKWEQMHEDPDIKKPPWMVGAKFDMKCLFD
jgi:recombination protein U